MCRICKIGNKISNAGKSFLIDRLGSCLTTLKKYYPDAKYLESLGISGSEIRKESSKTAVQNWLKKIGFTES